MSSSGVKLMPRRR